VTIQDTTPPTFGPAPDVNATTSDPSGAIVTYTAPTATDLGQDLPVTCNPPSGSLFPVGTTSVQCTANDGRGNSASVNFNVIVTLIDTQPPTFTVVPGPQTKEATGPNGAAADWVIEATDNVDPSPTITCDHTSGSTFPLGTTTVTCFAVDDSGNRSLPPDPSFTITVQDTTPPALSLPANITAEADSPAGKSVSFTATAVDIVSGSVPVTCHPTSGSTFGFGTTTVNCSAKDDHNNTANGSFTVTVGDHTPPAFGGIPSDRRVEANGPSGSAVNYANPTATDLVDGPIALVNCAPGSGGTFPLGTTNVTCSATDSHGNTGTASFHISVVDTTPPALYVPADHSVVATTATGISSSNDEVNRFLSSAIAADIVDPHPTIEHRIPAFLPVGVTAVTFEARDASGNTASKQAKLTVLPPGSNPVPMPIGPRRPAEVRNLAAAAGDGLVKLTWQIPAGVQRVVVTRSAAGGPGQVVYSGSAATYVDRGLLNGTEYRYIVTTVDASGVASAGVAVVALPKKNFLRSPKDGARLRKPPKLLWVGNAEADYYNVQLYRSGVKILSAWPIKAKLVLHRRWKYLGHAYTLTPGDYRWFVWPGFGARAKVDYGELLGSRTFKIVR
jgi:hypothetical protein